MNNDGEGCAAAVCLGFGFVVGLLLGSTFTQQSAERKYNQLAIDAGAAEYNDKTGEFEWKHLKDKEGNGN